MSTFQDITLEFKGKQYLIKSNTVYRLIQQLHEIIPLYVLLDPVSKDGKELYTPFDVLRAYTLCLNHAGAKVVEDDVYAEIFSAENPIKPTELIFQLHHLVVPPDKFKTVSNGDDEEEVKKK